MTVLRPLTAAREAAALETSWALAQSPATSLYPSFADGIKTREEFLRAASLRNAAPGEALAHLSDGEIQGLIRYEALPEDRLLTFSAFAARNPARATAEFLAYAAARYPGWQVDFGLHGENAGPRSVLEKAGWTLTEECRVCVCPLAGNISPSPAENVEPVTPRTFSEFAHLHDRTAGMYWNSPRLRAAYFRENTPWRLTLYRRQGRAAAALCWQRFGDLAEIFGVDFRRGIRRRSHGPSAGPKPGRGSPHRRPGHVLFLRYRPPGPGRPGGRHGPFRALSALSGRPPARVRKTVNSFAQSP